MAALFAPILFGASTKPLGDAAHIQLDGIPIGITAASFVAKPLHFRGGSIGEAAVSGVVNDLTVSGRMLEAIGGQRTVPLLIEDGGAVQSGSQGRGCIVATGLKL